MRKLECMALPRKRHPKLTPQTITAWRERKGWTKYRLAKELRVSPTLVGMWESGDRFPPYMLAYALNWLTTHDPT